MSNEEQAKQIFESAKDMMDSIRAVNGANYARTVEIALNMLKLQELLGHLISTMEDDIGQEKANKVWLGCNHIFSHVIGLASSNGGLLETADPNELVDWARKLLAIEENAAKALMGDSA